MTRNDRASPPGGDDAPSRPTPEVIERFRQVGLRLDRRGRLWHQDREVTHPRLKRAILSWLDRRESDGRSIVRLDDRRYAYIDVEDVELLALSARWEGDRAILAFNDGSEEELDYATLRVGGGDALYCSARRGKLEARLTTPAFHRIAERIEERPGGGFQLSAAGARFPIGERRASPPSR